MNKKDLCREVSQRLKTSMKTVNDVLDGILEQIKIQLVKGNKISIRYFGTFKPTKRKKRIGYNIQKHKNVEISAKSFPKLKFSKEIIKLMNRKQINAL